MAGAASAASAANVADAADAASVADAADAANVAGAASAADAAGAALIIDQPAAADETACAVCLTNKVKMVTMPCQHSVCCITCGDVCTQCPICRAEITQKIKYY